MSVSDNEWLNTWMRTVSTGVAEEEAYAENEIRKLKAVGITDEQLPAVTEFARVCVEINVSDALHRVGLRRDKVTGQWYWPPKRNRRS